MTEDDLTALIHRGALVAHRETWNGSFETFLAEHAAMGSDWRERMAEQLRESCYLTMNDNGATLWDDLPEDEREAVTAASAAFWAVFRLEQAALAAEPRAA
jgi:TRAP-type C4-dicarboxylate transport system substrate-binding protein